MKEVELKILEVSKREVIKKLKLVGAKKVFGPVLVKELYFSDDFENSAYTSLRLRKVGKKNELTLKYKKSKSRFLVREELETEVIDFGVTKAMLEKLGFRVFCQREKMREEYVYRGVKIEIDEYPSIPCFLEIEAKTEALVVQIIKKLGFEKLKTSNATATDVIKSYKANPDNLTFKKLTKRG